MKMTRSTWPPLWACIALGAAMACSSGLSAQGTPQTPIRPSPAPTPPPRAPAKTTIRIPEGTEVKLRLEDQLSSATATVGNTFAISTDEEIRLPGGAIIPAGFRGKGEVTEAHKKGMLGKAGELSVRLDYIRIGDVRLHLRANESVEGKNSVTTTVVLTVLITPLFLMHHGHEVVFPKGQLITGYVDQDTDIPMPIPEPPKVD